MRKFITGLLAAGCIAAVLTGCSSSGGAGCGSSPSCPAREAIVPPVASNRILFICVSLHSRQSSMTRGFEPARP